jgi:hypothetical protein
MFHDKVPFFVAISNKMVEFEVIGERTESFEDSCALHQCLI